MARDADALCAHAGEDAALAAVGDRAGGAYDPDLAALLCADGGRLVRDLGEAALWEAVMARSPEGAGLHGERLDAACAAVADFVDLKSPWTLGHSRGVAELAEAAAWRRGTGRSPRSTPCAAPRCCTTSAASAISNAIWDKPGPLDAAEWERVRLHPYYTERVLARAPELAELGGSAAPTTSAWTAPATTGACGARIAARERAAARRRRRLPRDDRGPRRPRRASAADSAAAVLRAEVRGGRLDAQRVRGGARGGRAPRRAGRRAWPAGLTDARGRGAARCSRAARPTRRSRSALGLSPKTVGHHVAHVYTKVGVSTRAAATLFAMEHDLLRD